MSVAGQLTPRVVLYEGAGTAPWAAAARFELLERLLARGYSVSRATGPGGVPLAQGHGEWVMGQCEQDAPPGCRDVRGWDAARVVGMIDAEHAARAGAAPEDWTPWFPVIDEARCTNCMQCLGFCLFGVFGLDAQHRIRVESPENCKTQCPACSRVCPEAAIIFPQYPRSPINGDDVEASHAAREAIKVDISALLGGDVYRVLRERSARGKTRFSAEQDADKALEERRKCLAQMAAAADIPPEVLMSLPSPAEIRRRAEEARARAEAARKGGD
ncbi:MAG: ferredoxin family protein [Verrucomicrobia bacterium]|nr:ferredoxin family protein [Verrucomicrobiota bacterium]